MLRCIAKLPMCSKRRFLCIALCYTSSCPSWSNLDLYKFQICTSTPEQCHFRSEQRVASTDTTQRDTVTAPTLRTRTKQELIKVKVGPRRARRSVTQRDAKKTALGAHGELGNTAQHVATPPPSKTENATTRDQPMAEKTVLATACTPTNVNGLANTAQSPRNGMHGRAGAVVLPSASVKRWRKIIKYRSRSELPVANTVTTHTSTARAEMQIKCTKRERTPINTGRNQRPRRVMIRDAQ
jgi:hypothetical protein